jgi:hypothetical protein
MNPIHRRKLLQTSLAGVGVLSAVGISLGLAGTAHSSNGAQSVPSQLGHESDDDHGATTQSRTPSSTPSVSAPQPSPPQATTSGS